MSEKQPERTPLVIPILGLSLLVFLLGTAVVQFRLFPYPQFLGPAYWALEAQLERRRVVGADPSGLAGQLSWREARGRGRGVTRYLPEESVGGYTLYTSTHASAAWLLGPQGDTVQSWALPFGEAFPDPPHIDRPVSEESIWWSHAELLPDGSLVAVYTVRGDTPYGYGLVKVDRDSNRVWAFADHVHHDLQLLDDGSLLTLTHDWRDSEGLTDVRAIRGEDRILDDAVVHLSPDGEVLRRVSVFDAFADSDFRWILESTYVSDERVTRWDLLHTNAARPVSEAFARHHDFAAPGMVMVSLRSPSLLALLDMEAQKIVWIERSFWRFQHDPVPLDDGTVLLFDNEGLEDSGEGASRILRFDPGTGAVLWSYEGTAEDPLYSQYSSHVEPLDGGNVLVTESNAGRIFEVAPDGTLVWEFWNPERAMDEGVEYLASIADGDRYQADELPFLER